VLIEINKRFSTLLNESQEGIYEPTKKNHRRGRPIFKRIGT